MWIAALSITTIVLLAANVLTFAALVPLEHVRVVSYLVELAVATLLSPTLVAAGLLTRKRFRTPQALLAGVAAGLVVSLALTATSTALSPPTARGTFAQWDAAGKRTHLHERCRTRCRHSGTRAGVCEDMCSCTVGALFTGRSDEELMRLTVEGPYGSLPRETNRLLGELAAVCAQHVQAAAAP